MTSEHRSSADESELIDLAVTGFANGGSGVARRDGQVIFVAGALPGERVRARIIDQRRNFAAARTVTVIDASEFRIAPLCPAAAAGAGCCDLSHVDPGYARELRSGMLGDVLQRIGRLSAADVGEGRIGGPPVAALADSPIGWRIRTRLAVDRNGVPGLRAPHSDRLVTAHCAAPAPGMLTDLVALNPTPGRELAVVHGSDGARHVAELTGAGSPPRRSADRRRGAQRARGKHAAQRRIRMLEGSDTVEYRLGARSWRVPVTGFWQAHRRAPEVFGATVAGFVAAHADRLDRPGGRGLHVWDLYGGAGVLASALMDDADVPPVAGVDIVDTAGEALAAAELALDGEPIRTHRGPVGSVAASLDPPDVVIVDPPRSGAGSQVLAAIADSPARLVVHVGCDAAAFARDLGGYRQHGFTVAGLTAFDAFPLTSHLEAIALLVR